MIYYHAHVHIFQHKSHSTTMVLSETIAYGHQIMASREKKMHSLGRSTATGAINLETAL